MKLLILAIFCILFLSCATLKKLPDANLTSDFYYLHQQEGGNTRVYVNVVNDSIRIITDQADQKDTASIVPAN
ncbi:MAG TPA: hypothetical protein VK589_26155, partial [Chryseolinea sp.]|nr:hypothetical protein [Chryseolinea sp.]